MASAEAKLEKRSFWAIYKPGQGKFVRWGTVAGISLVFVSGAWWLYVKTQLINTFGLATGSALIAAWLLIGGLLAFWIVNRPKTAEFMIMTESEMRKVTWPTRSNVINSTKVVILLTLLLAVLLWIVDAGFIMFFEAIHILKK